MNAALGKIDPRADEAQETDSEHLQRFCQPCAVEHTADLWRQLLLSGFPFIKRELLRDNPSKVQDVGDWADVVRDTLGADPEPIRQDLRLMLKGKAP